MVNHNHNNHDQENDANGSEGFGIGMLAGSLIGGLAGATAMLLLAPQSGKQTRAKLQQKSRKLRKQTTETVEEAAAQARITARQVTHDVRKQAVELEQRGQALFAEQKDNLASIVEAGKNAVQSNRN